MSKEPNIIQAYYAKVDKYWKESLNPTLKLSLLSLDPNIPNFTYTNNNTVANNSSVNAEFEIVYALEGPVSEGNNGILKNLELHSNDYSSEFFFQQVADYLTKLIKDFTDNSKTDYKFTIDIYIDVLEDGTVNNFQQSKERTQAKSDGFLGDSCCFKTCGCI